MIDIKKTLRDGFKLPETILNEYTERIKNIYVSNHQEQDGFGILAELIQLKLEIRRIGIKIHGEIESKNLHINDVINKLKIDIEAAEDDTGKKIYSNDAKRKIEGHRPCSASASWHDQNFLLHFLFAFSARFALNLRQ